jgi:hypothetical protein
MHSNPGTPPQTLPRRQRRLPLLRSRRHDPRRPVELALRQGLRQWRRLPPPAEQARRSTGDMGSRTRLRLLVGGLPRQKLQRRPPLDQGVCLRRTRAKLLLGPAEAPHYPQSATAPGRPLARLILPPHLRVRLRLPDSFRLGDIPDFLGPCLFPYRALCLRAPLLLCRPWGA